MKRLFYSLIIGALVSTLALGAEVRKLGEYDLSWGPYGTTWTSPAGKVVRYIPRYFDNNAFADNTNLFGKSLTGDGTGSITGFNIPLYVSQYLSVLDSITVVEDVRKYGAVGDNATDCLAAFNLAKAAASAVHGTVFVPPGIYRLSNTFTVTDINLIGIPEASVLVPNNGVTLALDIHVNPDSDALDRIPHVIIVSGIKIDGSYTSGATGIRIGHPNPLDGTGYTAGYYLDKFKVINFKGTNGLGVLVEDIVAFKIADGYISENKRGIRFATTFGAADGPTTGRIENLYVNYNKGIGVYVDGSFGLNFDGVYSEANEAENWYITTSGVNGAAQGIVLNNCQSEQGYIDWSGSYPQYGMVVDGNGGFAKVIITNTQFTQTPAQISAGIKYIRIIGASVKMDGNSFLDYATDNTILIEGAVDVWFGWQTVNQGTNWKTMVQDNSTAGRVVYESDIGRMYPGASYPVDDNTAISHGQATTPAGVVATGSVAGEIVTVTAITSTTFTVAIKKHDGTAGTTQAVYWILFRSN